MRRRTFLSGAGAAFGLHGAAGGPPVDFRYSPLRWQTAYCFPDDPHKSLVGHRGQLLCGHPGQGKNIDYFPLVVEFSMSGMQSDTVARQELEAPGIPIVHTRIERPEAFLDLTAFATKREKEGRVDNVILSIRPRTRRRLHAVPVVNLTTREAVRMARAGNQTAAYLGARDTLLMAADRHFTLKDTGAAYSLSLDDGVASGDRPLECLLRFPQEGQTAAQLADGFADPELLLEEARGFWREWRPFGGGAGWHLPVFYQDFLTACARNILQARELKNGAITFQVGPTVYRGLWVVDGNFILEAARYLGYDAEAQQGLETTWTYQKPAGNVTAGAAEKHWKDTAIAMFTLTRQAELAQDWSYFRKMQPNVARGVEFLRHIREQGREEGGPAGRYGILARGMADGGLRLSEELTNTVWSLAGLKAVSEAARRQGIAGFEPAGDFYKELRAGLDAAVRNEMRHHPDGFEYLPMLMKDDQLWQTTDEWLRPKPQVAQWALSHAIYPGLVFEKSDPVVKGHIALMQASTCEDVPAETGWIHNEGLWTYNAPFVAHAYLWAGVPDWARLTFTGFLNHASPLYCWREEQPFRNSVAAYYVGDMPHNWASAECVLYLRHMLALEDGPALRLLAGIGDPELSFREPFALEGSPTRFGRLALELAPAGKGWRLKFSRGKGPAPERLLLPARLGSGCRFTKVSGAEASVQGESVAVTPGAGSWEAVWSPADDRR